MNRDKQKRDVHDLLERYKKLYRDEYKYFPNRSDDLYQRLLSWKKSVDDPNFYMMKSLFEKKFEEFHNDVNEFDQHTHFLKLKRDEYNRDNPSTRFINIDFRSKNMTRRASPRTVSVSASTVRTSPNRNTQEETRDETGIKKRLIAKLLRVKFDLLKLKKEIEEKVATEPTKRNPRPTAWASMIITELIEHLGELNSNIGYYTKELKNGKVSIETLTKDVNNFETKYTDAKSDYKKYYGISGGRQTRSKRRKQKN